MGEPIPGDIPDPIYLKTQNASLKSDQIGFKGDFIRFSNIGVTGWEVLNTTTVPNQGSIPPGLGILQLQEDVDSTGLADAVANGAAFGPGSWIYAVANGNITPNAFVILNRTGNQIGFTANRTISVDIGDMSVASNVATVTTTQPHGLHVGAIVTTTGFTPADFNTVGAIVTAVNSDVEFEFGITAADATNTVAGFIVTPVLADYAHAQYIKKSGATFDDIILAGEIGIFSMSKGGQPIV